MDKYAEVDNYYEDGQPAGAIGLVPRKKDLPVDAPDLTAVIEKIKSGEYLALARENPTPDVFDARGILVPPGCIGGKTREKGKSIPPDVLEKIVNGDYKELARYMRERDEEARKKNA